MDFILLIFGALLFTVLFGVFGGLGFFFQLMFGARIKDPRKRVIPPALVGGGLLVCGLLWLFDIPTTCFVTGPGHLAVYDHILLAFLLAPVFVGMEAAWFVNKREIDTREAPLYGKGVWYALVTLALGWGVGVLQGGWLSLPMQLVFALFAGAVLLVNTLYRWVKFKTAPNFKVLVADLGIGIGILLLEGMIVRLLPQTRFAAFNLQTALSTTAAVGLTLAVVIRFVLNQDDRPGIFAMLRLLFKSLLYIAAGAAFLWFVWYQIKCDDNKAFLMTLAFFGPVVLGILMGYLLLLRQNGSLEFGDPKEQNCVHGLLPVALALVCFLSGAVQFSNMEYRHETRCELVEWEVLDQYGDLSISLEARDQASRCYELIREEAGEGTILRFTLCGCWRPFDWPWEFGVSFIKIPLDAGYTTVVINESYFDGWDVALRYINGEWVPDFH